MINTSDVITFYGRSVEELRREMAPSIGAHLEACRAKGIEPSRTYSGRFDLCLPPDEHGRVAVAAAAAGKCMMNLRIAERLANHFALPALAPRPAGTEHRGATGPVAD